MADGGQKISVLIDGLGRDLHQVFIQRDIHQHEQFAELIAVRRRRQGCEQQRQDQQQRIYFSHMRDLPIAKVHAYFSIDSRFGQRSKCKSIVKTDYSSNFSVMGALLVRTFRRLSPPARLPSRLLPLLVEEDTVYSAASPLRVPLTAPLLVLRV